MNSMALDRKAIKKKVHLRLPAMSLKNEAQLLPMIISSKPAKEGVQDIDCCRIGEWAIVKKGTSLAFLLPITFNRFCLSVTNR